MLWAPKGTHCPVSTTQPPPARTHDTNVLLELTRGRPESHTSPKHAMYRHMEYSGLPETQVKTSLLMFYMK